MNSIDFIMSELAKLPEDRGLRQDGDVAYVRCWNLEHKGGQESRPSAKINLVPVEGSKGMIPAGRVWCWTCRMSQSWSEIADRFGLSPMHSGMNDRTEPTEIFSDAERAQLLGNASAPDLLPPDAIDWPEEMMWRTINGETVRKTGGMIYYDRGAKETRALLRVMVRGEMVGYVRANMVAREGQLNYLNSKGKGWAKDHGLLPYDYVRKMVRLRRKRGLPVIIYIVEGPRDSLNLVQYGLCGLAILGTNQWSAKKLRLLLALEPDMVVFMLDNDDAGNEARRRITGDLQGKTLLRRMSFPTKEDGSKYDASDLKEHQCKSLEKRYRKIITDRWDRIREQRKWEKRKKAGETSKVTKMSTRSLTAAG